MKPTIPPPNWLRSFEAAGRLGSFTEAATELCVTPSAVSQQVRLLEHHLGAKLFLRLPRGLELTDQGKSFLPAVQGGFSSITQAAADLFDSAGSNLVVLRVNTSFAYCWLANRLTDFQAANPSIQLRIYLTHWPEDTDWEGLSLEIRYGDGRWAGFKSDRLTEEEVFPVCAPEIRNRSPRFKSPLDILGQPLLHTVGEGDGWNLWLEAAGVSGQAIPRGFQFDSTGMALAVAAAGGGIALAKSFLAKEYLESGQLVAPFNISAITGKGYFLVAPADRVETPETAAFRSWIMENIASGSH
ncbi:MAG: LysR substrate-binding domain-containing protein [Pseudomonadales bacterium]|nr:LysR substrate-binding domain-containing protein [Pseudomonadales bacterium]NRA14536.1 LysR family transcriptional regulator [Oceanospirillaceae bacterium]